MWEFLLNKVSAAQFSDLIPLCANLLRSSSQQRVQRDLEGILTGRLHDPTLPCHWTAVER